MTRKPERLMKLKKCNMTVVEIKKELVKNDFFIIYDNQYYTILRHFIENDFVTGIPSPNEYRFHLEKESDTINVTLEIFGPDSEKFEKQMAKIENAKNNIWGRPKKMNEYLCY